MKLELRVYPDPVLAQKAQPVEAITPELRKLAEDMAETMYASEGIGLAAPQVGESIRFVVIDITGPDVRGDLRYLVNPVITEKSSDTVETEEGCLSVAALRAKVKRAERVTVTAQDLDGNDITIEADEMMAICLQHELDHLDGVLFIDHISRLKRSLYDKKVKKWLRQQDKVKAN
ncbi:peptide deformylase [Desulfovibrio ferrophilus]|uniref:Peptide deformylase n=1 Tax=Desulfovibrio ferrophilus TaxID=241368 RepID=A0A2Z6B1K8_9BACT|nr:peptide deformylase [Desulfovibrio ferrophilus]BBD09372.1 peptide deformylase [Desulfovibrio ferrophilus]